MGVTGKRISRRTYTHWYVDSSFYKFAVVDTYNINILFEDRCLHLEVFDTNGGFVEYEDVRRLYFNERDGILKYPISFLVAIACYDCTNRNSFLNLQSGWLPLWLRD